MVESESAFSRTGYGAAFGAYLIWGLAPIFWKTVGSVPSGELTALRCVFSLVLLVAFLFVVRGVSPRDLFEDKAAARAHLLAGLLLGGNWLVFVYAVATNRVVEASLGYFINPMISVALGAVIFGERLTRRRWFAIAIAVLGVSVLTIDAGSLPWISLVLAISFAVYGVVKKQSTRGPIEGLGLEMIWIAPIAVGYLVWTVVQGDFTFGTGAAPYTIWVLGLVTAAPLLFFATAAKLIPLWAIGLMQYIAPSLQFSLGVLVYGEEANPARLAGFAIIWVGLVVFTADSVRSVRSGAAQR